MLLLNLAGNIGVAAYGVVANYSIVAVSVFNGLAQGTQPLFSESYGAGNSKDAINPTLRHPDLPDCRGTGRDLCMGHDRYADRHF
mgnify:CR=1 FL=1